MLAHAVRLYAERVAETDGALAAFPPTRRSPRPR